MKLWIRSQNEEILSTYKYLCVGGTYCNEIIGDNIRSLGTYDSKGRALEVLDEIQKLLKTAEFNDDINVIVYQMPEK